MAYKIEPQALTQFIQEDDIRLPRFQRKKTWKPSQNFELCISIFKQYPIGVVIVNRENNILWLLDGRQRREVIQTLNNNPCEVYEWAIKFLHFKRSDDPQKLKEIFWGKVEDYLQRDTEESSEEDDNINSEDNNEYPESDLIEDVPPTFDSTEQQKGLETLCRLVLLCHGNSKNAFPNFFKFAKHFVNNRTKEIILDDLLRFLIDLGNKEQNITEQIFLDSYVEKANLNEKEEKECKEHIQEHWNKIKESINVLVQYKRILKDARIGVIELVNATPLDAQNIFSLVNKGGTPLKAEELLSAKPFWNEIVSDYNNDTKESVKQLYEKLALNCPENVCRWDVVATIISRLEKKNCSLFFKNYKNINNNEKFSVEEVTIGFKILSAIFEGGISGKHVSKLEKRSANYPVQIDEWVTQIDDVIETICSIEELLSTSKFFKCLLQWKQNIMELTSLSIALEFVAILYKHWNDLHCSTRNKNSTNNKCFKRDALSLLDRLVFEYIVGNWKGSSDSKMAKDLKDYKQRLGEPISEETWRDILKRSCNGDLDFRPVMLYYDCAIRGKTPERTINITWDNDQLFLKLN